MITLPYLLAVCAPVGAVIVGILVQRNWLARKLARHHAGIRAVLAAHLRLMDERYGPLNGAGSYAAGHDAEQAVGSVLPPPGAADPIYGTGRHRADARDAARGASEAPPGQSHPQARSGPQTPIWPGESSRFGQAHPG